MLLVKENNISGFVEQWHISKNLSRQKDGKKNVRFQSDELYQLYVEMLLF